MGILDLVRDAVITVGKTADGYHEAHARVPVPGHNVQIVHEAGSRFYTVFVDGDCGHVTADKVASWIEARL